jgi:hypothetical protein
VTEGGYGDDTGVECRCGRFEEGGFEKLEEEEMADMIGTEMCLETIFGPTIGWNLDLCT